MRPTAATAPVSSLTTYPVTPSSITSGTDPAWNPTTGVPQAIEHFRLEVGAGDRGVRLSGGQRQRIAIARALLKDAPILLLDEATSALDSESEETIIREALDRLTRGRTVIAVAHRLSTLRGFDRIVVLREGRIVQDGPPGELMVIDGPYRRLIQREMTRLAAEAA